jgi:cytochrome c-type biogenesis protein CcmH/NrfG
MHSLLAVLLVCCLPLGQAMDAENSEKIQRLYKAGSDYFQAKQYEEAKQVWVYLLKVLPQFQVVCGRSF